MIKSPLPFFGDIITILLQMINHYCQLQPTPSQPLSSLLLSNRGHHHCHHRAMSNTKNFLAMNLIPILFSHTFFNFNRIIITSFWSLNSLSFIYKNFENKSSRLCLLKISNVFIEHWCGWWLLLLFKLDFIVHCKPRVQTKDIDNNGEYLHIAQN